MDSGFSSVLQFQHSTVQGGVGTEGTSGADTERARCLLCWHFSRCGANLDAPISLSHTGHLHKSLLTVAIELLYNSWPKGSEESASRRLLASSDTDRGRKVAEDAAVELFVRKEDMEGARDFSGGCQDWATHDNGVQRHSSADDDPPKGLSKRASSRCGGANCDYMSETGHRVTRRFLHQKYTCIYIHFTTM